MAISSALVCAAVPLPSLQDAAPADLASEPHHKLLLDNDQLRAFAVMIPHQQFYVRQERSILVVTLEGGEIVIWREGQSPVQHFMTSPGQINFFSARGARGMRNDSNSGYRNITVEFKDAQITNYGYRPDTGKWDYGPSTMAMPVDPNAHFVNSLELEHAVVNDVQLLTGQDVTLSHASRGMLLIAVSKAELGTAGASDNRINLAEGDVRWVQSGSARITNLGRSAARFTVIKLK